jgi:hypothetical protein
MKKSMFLLMMATGALFSCGQGSKPTPDTVDKKTLDATKNGQSPNGFVYRNDVYTDSAGGRLIIQNGLPKGGMKYTDSTGEVYVYAVFWTRLTNETGSPLELKIDFPVNSYEVPTLPGKYFKILVPPDTLTLDKEPLFLYGLTDIESFLEKSLHKSSSLKRTIHPKESTGFYVVMLCLIEGAHGIVRTTLGLEGQDLFYRINGKEIRCGSINLKNLTLQK